MRLSMSTIAPITSLWSAGLDSRISMTIVLFNGGVIDERFYACLAD